MKPIFYCIFSFVLFLVGCKKTESSPVVDNRMVKIPFETQHIRVEAVAASLPADTQTIHFIDAAVGFAAAFDGSLHKTIDGGRTWALVYRSSIKNLPLPQVLFTSPGTGYAVGGSASCGGTGCTPPGGLVLRTTDGGATWAVVYRTSRGEVASIAANDKGELFIVSNETGSQILRSADAGSSWSVVAVWPYQLTKLAFDRNMGFCASANGKINNSTNSGGTWSEGSSFTYPYLNEIAFSTGIGFCVTGYGPVFRTVDNSRSWTETSSSPYSALVINALTPTSCLIFGAGRYSGGDFGVFNGSIRQSVDGGNKWAEFELTNAGVVRSSSFYASTAGYVLAGTDLLRVRVK